MDSSTVVIPGVSVSVPSRSRLNRLSPAWVSPWSRVNPRKPQVPLMVWMVRKTLLSVGREVGSRSSETRSRSSWSRFS